MYTLEIENSFERDAMMHRIVSNLNDDIPHPNSTDPYEIIAYLLQKNEHARYNHKILRLISEIVDKINNSFIKFSGFCTVADLSIKSKEFDHARYTLNQVYGSISDLQTKYEKILILSDLTILFSGIDKNMANICLDEGIKYLENIESDKNSIARRQLVMAIASLHAVNPDKELLVVATRVSDEIVDPVDYIHSLIAIHGMNEGNEGRRKEILHQMILSTDKIYSAYNKSHAPFKDFSIVFSR